MGKTGSTKYRICLTCPVPHYENCPTCFGFGIYDDLLPISASKAVDADYPSTWKFCPECGSTPKGLPAKALDTQDLADALQRDAQLKKTRKELLRALFNRAGLDRLRAVTDADWREAEARDENTG